MEDHEINSLAAEMEVDIKRYKDGLYRLGWYMRGSVSIETLMYDTDLEDHDIMQNIVKDNIELTKNSKMPLL